MTLVERAEVHLDRVLNPILHREIRGTFRGLRFLFVLMGLLGLVSLSLLIGLGASASREVFINPAEIGGRIHTIFLAVLFFTLLFILPTFASTSIVSEDEKNTHDLLRTTTLSEWSIVWGKFLASMAYAIVFLTASLPLGSISFLFGGVTVGNLLASYLFLGIITAMVNMTSIFVSSQMRRSRSALSASMIFAVAFTAVLVYMMSVKYFADFQLEVSRIFGIPTSVLDIYQGGGEGLTGEKWWLCLVAIPLYLFAAVVSFSCISAVNKLKPLSGNRSTNLKTFYLVFLPLGGVLVLGLLLATPTFLGEARSRSLTVMYGAFGLFMLLSTFFATEDPVPDLPERLKRWTRGWRRFLAPMGPGAVRGYFFSLLSSVVILAVLYPQARAFLRPVLQKAGELLDLDPGRPVFYTSLVLGAMVFLFASFSLLTSVVLSNDKMRKALVSLLIVTVLFSPLVSYGIAHSFKAVEHASPGDLGYTSPIVALGSLSTGYWDRMRWESSLRDAPAEEKSTVLEDAPAVVFPYYILWGRTPVPVFAGFLVFSAVTGALCLALTYVLVRRKRRLAS
jgi:ABC-type transport system involved in multi-copper enzyme maturation permease subunit